MSLVPIIEYDSLPLVRQGRERAIIVEQSNRSKPRPAEETTATASTHHHDVGTCTSHNYDNERDNYTHIFGDLGWDDFGGEHYDVTEAEVAVWYDSRLLPLRKSCECCELWVDLRTTYYSTWKTIGILN